MGKVTYTYPTSRELRTIMPAKIARTTQERLGFKIMPIRGINKAAVEWTQKDNYRGLQRWRGYEGQPTRVQKFGAKSYRYDPGVYGEFWSINEQELTTKAGDVVGDVVVSVDTEVLEAQDTLINRETDLIEALIWQVLTTGTFAVLQSRGDGTSVIVFTDTFDIQTLTVGVTWSTVATATPLKNLRQLPILARGKGLNFRRKATAYMNQATFNNLVANTNAADFGGYRLNGTLTGPLITIEDVNKILFAADLPMIEIYDEMYFDENNDPVLYIPDGKVVVVGAHISGERLGEYLKTKNIYANNQGASYSFIKDSTQGGTDGGVANNVEIGKGLEVHQGHNGGPVLYYPSGIFVLNV